MQAKSLAEGLEEGLSGEMALRSEACKLCCSLHWGASVL